MLVSLRTQERFPALYSTDYRRLFYNTVLAAAARWALMLARGWLVFDLTGSSGAVGIVTFAGMAPFLVAGPIGGALADRFDRRRMAMGAAASGVLFSAVLALLTLSGVVATWQVVLLAVVQGITMALVAPAQEALLPSLVAREHLLNAVALSGIARHGSRIAGPLGGGILLTTLGAGYAFLLSAGLLLIATWQISRIAWRPTAAAAEAAAARSRGVAADVREGAVYAWQDRRVRLILLLIGAHCGFTMAFDSLLPQLARDLGGGSATYSAFVVGIGAGAIVGTIGLAMVRQESARGSVLALTGVGSGLAMLTLGLANSPAMAVLGAALAGATQATYMAISAALIQSIVPDALRGRTMSLYIMLAAGHMAFVNLGFGFGADAIGVRPLLIGPGLLWVAVFLAATVALTDLRHLLRRGAFLPVRTAVSSGG